MPVITLGKRKQFLFPNSEPQLSHAWQVRAEMALTITTEITPALDICLHNQVVMPNKYTTMCQAAYTETTSGYILTWNFSYSWTILWNICAHRPTESATQHLMDIIGIGASTKIVSLEQGSWGHRETQLLPYTCPFRSPPKTERQFSNQLYLTPTYNMN